MFYYIHTCRVITRTSECYHVSDESAQDMNRIGYGHAALFRCILPHLCVGIASSLPNSASLTHDCIKSLGKISVHNGGEDMSHLVVIKAVDDDNVEVSGEAISDCVPATSRWTHPTD